jgi:hypothetical protein
MKRFATASFCLALALLTFFQFPGHTWLQQDTQIYAPILEHLRDPSLLRNEILVQQPHVAWSLYDEAALGLRAITGLGFREVLAIQQIATRALGVWGILLLAGSLGLSWSGAAVTALICSLGAVIAGPTVLTVEYEPTPRAFAVPLLVCAMGLASRRRYRHAGIAAGAALLYHPPTALPFWAVWLCVARLQALAQLTIGAVILLIASRFQSASQTFFARLSPEQESLQRMRTAYVYLSTWPWEIIAHHLVVFAVLAAAAWRLREKLDLEARAFLLGLPVMGLLSMPVSWLLLEHWKWGLMPQVQPMRILLFVTFAAQFLAAAAGVRAGRSAEGVAWLAVAFLPSMPDALTWKWLLVALALAAAAALSGKWAPAAVTAAFFVIPAAGAVNYPNLHNPDLAQLSEWARANTSKDAVFVFSGGGRTLDPGVFRSEALRAVYVDWKGGGQVNYLSGFGEQWWFRWQQINGRPADLARYGGLGITYAIVRGQPPLNAPAEFENRTYAVYRTSGTPPSPRN